MHNDTAWRGATELDQAAVILFLAVTTGRAGIYDEGLFGYIGIERISRIGPRSIPATDAMF